MADQKRNQGQNGNHRRQPQGVGPGMGRRGPGGFPPERQSQGVGPGMGRRGPGGVTIENAKDPKKAAGRLIGYFGSQALLLLIATVFIVVDVVLRSLSPALIGGAIRNYLEINQDLAGFTRQLYIIGAVAVSSWVAGALSHVLITVIANRLIFRFRAQAFEHLQDLSMSYFDSRGVGDIISRMTNDIETIYNALQNGVGNLASGLFSIVGVIIAMLILNIQLTMIVLVMVPIMLLITRYIGKRVREAFRENQRYIGLLSGNIQESVSAVKVIKTFFREEDEFESFEALNRQVRDVGTKAEFISYIFNPIINFVTSMAVALMVGIGGALVIGRSEVFSVGLLTAFILYSRRFFQPLRQMTSVYNLLQSALAGAERIFAILDTKPDIVQPESPKIPADFRGDIEFRDVRFGYEPEKIVLDGVSLTAGHGQTVAIVGPTGAGKTTMVNLLSRYYDVDAGSILIDGIDVREYDLRALRAQMGVVLQEPFFFARSIRENLMYGNPDASREQVEEAARLANADHFIRRLPEGYDTELTERGMNVSQGERQLLAITRAILANPKILILDEATSNIDSLTEIHIQRGLLELMKGRTSLIIAHRLSTIKNADKVLVIHDHTIIEEGTHTELMEAGGFYSRLYSAQLTMPDVTEEMEI